MLDALRTVGMRRVAATLMVAAAASLSFPFVLFAPSPLSANVLLRPAQDDVRGEGPGVGPALAIYDCDQAGGGERRS